MVQQFIKYHILNIMTDNSIDITECCTSEHSVINKNTFQTRCVEIKYIYCVIFPSWKMTIDYALRKRSSKDVNNLRN